jgi:hypothetical protein
MSDDEAPVGAPAITETQNYELKDLFGESSDEDEIRGKSGGGNDDDFGSDSDDGAPAKKSGSRLLKGGSSKKSSDKEKRKAERKAEKAKKGKKEKKSSKRSRSDSNEDSHKISKKSKQEKEVDNSKYADDGDAYDSDDDIVATAEDDDFIVAEDGELAGVVSEYANDNQNFQDERPEDYGIGKPKKSKKGGGSSSSDRVSTKANDVFSQTLAGMKKAKVQELTDADKQRVATEFLKIMGTAALKDDAAYEAKQPATHKLNMLKKVQDMVGVRTMQATLLDFDLLGVLSDWITPKAADNTLPSHTIRTAVYQMLSLLPCQSDHLKRKSDATGRTIGMTIMALFRHKSETRENKLMLKAIIEKWSRPIFRKQSDARSADLSGNVELQQVVRDQIKIRAEKAAAVAADGSNVSFDDAINNRGATEANAQARARTVFSAGFLYTARPESKVTINREANSANDDNRKNMLKKMNDMKNANRSGVGKKEVKSTMDMAQTGRNKA